MLVVSLPLFLSELKAVFMSAVVVIFLCTFSRVCSIIGLIEVKVSSEFGRLSLPKARLGIYAAGC
jgi:hypothetical protein